MADLSRLAESLLEHTTIQHTRLFRSGEKTIFMKNSNLKDRRQSDFAGIDKYQTLSEF
jgi:hypothetical protein